MYPPKGARSNGPIRAAMYGEATGYQTTANDEIIVMPMIETKQAIDNLDAILDVPGLTGVYIGPSDLGFSYGLIPILDREEPMILEIYQKILDACAKRGLYAGIHCGSAAYAAKAIKMGFKLVTISNDSGIMQVAAKAAVKHVRTEAAEHV
jgi:4-hydroxy-2-oxoheptanedioate aldolase